MLTDRQKDALRRVLSEELEKPEYTGKTLGDIHTMLTEPVEVQGEGVQKPAPITISGLLSGLSQETIGKLVNWVHLTDLRDKIRSQDIEGVALWGQLLVAGGIIPSGEFAAIQSALTATVTVPGPVTVTPPLINSLLSGANLRAVLGDDFFKAEMVDGKPTVVPISMPNTITVDDLAEVIPNL